MSLDRLIEKPTQVGHADYVCRDWQVIDGYAMFTKEVVTVCHIRLSCARSQNGTHSVTQLYSVDLVL